MALDQLRKTVHKLTCFLNIEQQSEKIWRLVTLKNYEYPYLKETQLRGEVLFKILKPYLKPKDRFLDMLCGYSPLATPLIKHGYNITGFDANKIVIKSLKESCPSGQWFQSSFENLKLKGYSVFLLLGAYELCCESSFVKTLTELILQNKPRLFFLEANKNSAKAPTIENPFIDENSVIQLWNLQGYNSVLRLLLNYHYRVVAVGQYDAKLKAKWASIRIYAVLMRETTSSDLLNRENQ